MQFFDVTVSFKLRVDTVDTDIAERMGLDYTTEYMMYNQEEVGEGNYTINFPEEPLPIVIGLQSIVAVESEIDPRYLA